MRYDITLYGEHVGFVADEPRYRFEVSEEDTAVHRALVSAYATEAIDPAPGPGGSTAEAWTEPTERDRLRKALEYLRSIDGVETEPPLLGRLPPKEEDENDDGEVVVRVSNRMEAPEDIVLKCDEEGLYYER
jgi:hypothetical protein